MTIPSTLNLYISQYNSYGDPFYYTGTIDEFKVDPQNPSCKSLNGFLLSKDGKHLIHGRNINAIIPSSVQTIGNSSFWGMNNLTEIEIPENVTKLELRAFSGSGLEKLTFKKGMESIGLEAFLACRSLKQVTLYPASYNFRVF